MPYDKSLDKELFSETAQFPNTEITVSVYSYNEGTPKLQISRKNIVDDDARWAKLGRMTKEEAEQVIPLCKKAIEHM